MKKMIPIFLFLTLPFLLFSKTKNTLASSAGTMNLSPQNYCDGEIAFPMHNGDESLDAGDLLKFVIHDNAGASLGNMFGGQGDVSTAYAVFPGMTTNTTYYISAIAGMDDGTGKVDLTDPELSVSQGTPVTFFDPVNADAGTNQTLTCNNSEVILGGSGTSVGSEFSYEWTFGGNWISSELNPQATAGGEYCLSVTNAGNGCTAMDCVTVDVNATVPGVTTTVSGNLDCNNGTVVITAQANNCGICDYLWSNNSVAPTIAVNNPGTYTITVSNSVNGCSAVKSVTVIEDIIPPIAVINVNGNINCSSTCVTLDAFGSSTGPDINYLWYLNSTPLVSSSGLVIDACIPGEYELTVTNTTNGCTTTVLASVTEDTDLPTADAGPDQALGCGTTSVILDGSGSATGPNFIYEWIDDNGTSIGTGITLSVTSTGTYFLMVTNAANGCTNSDEVEVTGTGVFAVDLGDDLIFDCVNSQMTLQGVTIPTGPEYSYLWSTFNGNLVTGESTPNPTVNTIGTYVIEVTDVTNGCIGTDQVTIYNLDEVFDVTPVEILNCTLSPKYLDADLLFFGFDLSFEWTTADGQIISGENTLSPLVGSIGVYSLEVTDNNTGCTSVKMVQVVEPIFPTPVIDTPDGTIINCFNGGVVLDAGNSTVTQPASFAWTDPNGNQIGTNISIIVDVAGAYQLVVTGGNGCESQTSIVVDEDIAPAVFTLLPVVTLDCANNFTQEIGPVLSGINPNNVSYDWVFNGVFISSDSSIIVDSDLVGVFQLTVTNLANGCMQIMTMQSVLNGFDFNISTTPAGCDLQDGTATAMTGLANSLIEWSTGEQGSTISNLAKGWYSVTLTDTDNDCSLHENFFVDEDISCKVVIAGYIVEDPNSTCTYDASMEGVGCVMVKLEPLGIYTLTDSTGYYEFIVDDGTYDVEYIGSPEVELICPTPGTYNVVLDVNGSVSDGNHFFVQRHDIDLCITKFTGNARPGFLQFNCVQVCNYSDDPQDAIATFMHDSIFSDQAGWPTIIPAYNNQIAPTYSYDAATNTFSWNLDDLAPGECRKIMWYMKVPLTAQVGYVLSTEAKVNPILGDFNPDNNCLAWNQEITGSYDPNDKRNFVGESQWGGAIYEDDMTMEYAIRFQNVGNDTAFTVVVRDTLDDAHLDVTSIRGFIASHDMQVEFEENNILIFRFENINLVDSFTNEPGSNGWLSFEIDRLQGQDFGTEIKNQAAIYFDFNDPVITNEVVNTLTEDPVSIFYPKENKIDVRVMPTITDGNVLLQYVLEKPTSLSIQLLNAKGQQMQEFDFGKKQTGEHSETLNLKDFPAGVYFVFVKTEDGNAVARVIKQ